GPCIPSRRVSIGLEYGPTLCRCCRSRRRSRSARSRRIRRSSARRRGWSRRGTGRGSVGASAPCSGRARGPARSPTPSRSTSPVADPEAAEKRASARERKVAAGLDELDRWIGDIVRRGLAATRSEGYAFWDAEAARLVDAQAGSLARSVRNLGSVIAEGPDWP